MTCDVFCGLRRKSSWYLLIVLCIWWDTLPWAVWQEIFWAQGVMIWPASLLAFDYAAFTFCDFVSSLYTTLQSRLPDITVLLLTRQGVLRACFSGIKILFKKIQMWVEKGLTFLMASFSEQTCFKAILKHGISFYTFLMVSFSEQTCFKAVLKHGISF